MLGGDLAKLRANDPERLLSSLTAGWPIKYHNIIFLLFVEFHCIRPNSVNGRVNIAPLIASANKPQTIHGQRDYTIICGSSGARVGLGCPHGIDGTMSICHL